MTNHPTAFVVDDHAAIRKGLTLLLSSVAINVRTFPSAEQFLDHHSPKHPGCLILDVRMTGMSGLELQHELQQRDSHIPIIMISGHADIPMAVQAVKHGALEFLEKPIREQLLLDALRRAFSCDTQRRANALRLAGIRDRLATLTPRERQVLTLVVDGKANKVIATDLGVSQKTVEFHRAHIMRKMRAPSLADLVRQVSQLAHPRQNPPVPTLQLSLA